MLSSLLHVYQMNACMEIKYWSELQLFKNLLKILFYTYYLHFLNVQTDSEL